MKIKFLNYNKNLDVIPDLLILIFSPVAAFYHHIIYDFSFIAYYSIIFLFFTLVSLSLYIKLYQWRKLEQSVSSFIFFFLNVIQLFLYLFAISLLFNMFYYKISNPIYLDDLSILSQYKYLFLSLISIFFIIFWVIIKITGYNIITYSSYITYPYLKEEIRKILDTWNDSFIGDFSIWLTNKLADHKIFKASLFFSAFLLFYVHRLLLSCLFIGFCFFNQDLRLIVYFIPFKFIFWILDFVYYYYKTFFMANYNYINDLLIISLNNPLTSAELDSLLFTREFKDFSFTLSTIARKNGLSDSDLSFTVKTWLRIIHIRSSFIFYQQVCNYFSILLVVLNFFCWSYIAYHFFFNNIIMATFWVVIKRSFHNTRTLYAPRDARFFNNERAQNQLRSATAGKYGPGHPVIGENTSEGYRVDGYATNDPKRGIEILPNNISPISKKQGPQYFVPFDEPVTMPTADFRQPIPGSETKLAERGVETKIKDSLETGIKETDSV